MIKKILVLVLLICLCLTCACTEKPAKEPNGTAITGTASPTIEPTLEPTAEPTEEPTEEPTPTETPKPVYAEDFSDAAFLGNSVMLGYCNYGCCGKGDCYGVVSLSIFNLDEKKATGSSVTVMESLRGKSYKRIYMLFGLNELGYEVNSFINKYEEVTNQIKSMIPDVEIYVLSVTPVSKKVDGNDKEWLNMNNVRTFNTRLQDMCGRLDLNYVDVCSILVGSDGFMNDDYSKDGIHLNSTACEKMLEFIKNH